MCVADNKPNDPPEQRFWVLMHNLRSVANQATENRAIMTSLLEAAVNPDDLDTARRLIHAALEVERPTTWAATVATTSFAQVRSILGIDDRTISEWAKNHRRTTRANTADHP